MSCPRSVPGAHGQGSPEDPLGFLCPPLLAGLPCMWPGRLRWVLNPQPPGEAGWARTVSADSPWSCLWPKTMACRPAPSTTWLAAAYLLPGHGEGRVKPLLKGAAALEDGGQQEVEERPELGQLVLQRRARQQQAARRHVVRVEDLRQLAVVVLHAVAFVHDHVLPADLQAKSGWSGEDRRWGCPLSEKLTAIRHKGSGQNGPLRWGR